MGTYSEEKAKRIGEELDALEQQAGIREKAERAREGRFMPDLNETPDQYFDAEYDEVRRRTRRTYFDVADLDLRRNLIATERRLHEAWLRSWDEDIQKAEQEVRAARAAVDRLPWGMAAGVGGGCVALAYYFGGLSGAIGGAVVGLFMGGGTIANARADARRNLEAAQESLTLVKADKKTAQQRPEKFSVGEQISGERDPEFEYARGALG